MESRVQKSGIVLILFLAIGLLGMTPCFAVEAEFIEVNPNKTDKRSWGPEQATGAPDTHQAGDIPTAWASLHPDRGEEWLQIDFDKEVNVAEIRIRETFNPGAVTRVAAILSFSNFDGELTIWEGQDPTRTAPAEFSIKPKKEVTTNSIRIYLDTKRRPGWNEIDAVELIGKDGTRQWASHATASSTYAERPQPSTNARRNAQYPRTVTPSHVNPQNAYYPSAQNVYNTNSTVKPGDYPNAKNVYPSARSVWATSNNNYPEAKNVVANATNVYLNADPKEAAADPFADFYQKRVLVLLEGDNSSKHPITVEGTLVRSAGGFLVIKDAIYSKMIVVSIRKVVYLKTVEPAKK